MKVLKFGSKAIANPEKFKLAAQIAAKKGKSIIVVPAIPSITAVLEDISDYFYKKNIESANLAVSALAKEFEAIIHALYETRDAQEYAQKYIDDTLDYIRSFSKGLFTLFEQRAVLAQGELASAFLFRLILSENKTDTAYIPALDFMRIDKNHEPDTLFIKEKLNELLAAHPSDMYITEGYICRNFYDEIDDFRQGGNDFAASLIGAAVGAQEIQVWTDMDSMKYIDENIVPSAGAISSLGFDEAAELAYFGDKVLHPASILPAKLANIPVRILSIFRPDDAGTLISANAEKNKIKAVAAKDNITAITVRSGKMLLAYGFLRRVAEVFERYQTPIDMLASSEVSISMTIDNTLHLSDIVDDLKKYGTVSVDSGMAIICIVGDLKCGNVQTRSKIMNALAQLPLRIISYGGSDYNFSFLIKMEDKEQTLKILNEKLF
ncbi:MAG: aspartate kinase [Prevotella sp.]|jgi:aspartate kinase|nr:aspartate kinase [Prevotella sp.]